MQSETLNIYSPGGTKIKMASEGDPDKPDYTNPEYEYWMQISEGSRALMQGTRGMREAGKIFLPQFKREDDADYAIRLSVSIVKNAFRKTVQFLSGQVFQTAIGYDEAFPDDIQEDMNDVDRAGSSLDVFSKRVFENGIATGVSHILVEAPANNQAQTKADEAEAGVRPYLKEIRPENLIGWQTDELGNLVQLRILEMVTKPAGAFGMEYVPQVRVLSPGAWELWQKTNKNDFAKISEGTTSLSEIPLYTFIPGMPFSILTGESPLQDLVDLQIHHWQSFSDQKNILHVARLPILFAKMLGLSEFTVGSSKAIMADNEEADMKFVEAQGNAIAAGQQDLKETEDAMSLFGLQQMMNRTGSMTATEKALSSAESNSSLGMWVNEFEDTLAAALGAWGQYTGDKIDPEMVKLPSAFRKGFVSMEVLKLMLDYVDAGILSKQSVFDTLIKQDFLADDLSYDAVQADIELEATNAGPNGLAGLFANTGL